MLPDALDAALMGAAAEGKRVKFVYLIPTFQNPQAWTMPIERRREIVEVAARHGAPILEDDGIAEVQVRGRSRRRGVVARRLRTRDPYGVLQQDRRPRHADRISCGVPRDLLETVMPIKGSRGVTQFGALTVHRFATTRLAQHMARLNRTLRSRRDAMFAALGEHGKRRDVGTPRGRTLHVAHDARPRRSR